ncbi:MAG TPA: slipin family protein [Fimbriimonadaceae bacterium]|nr:slipin family protein [Fimbriimonadaceae bacterium]
MKDYAALSFSYRGGSSHVPIGLGRSITIFEYQRGLLYHHGRFVRELGPGRHRFFSLGLSCNVVDIRPASQTLNNQELITRDLAPIRLTLAAAVRVVDARRYLEGSQVATETIYTVLQLAARDVVNSLDAEALLTDRSALRGLLEGAIGERLQPYGVALDWFEVRDIMLPGDAKKAFAAVVLARQEGLAALERARGETAALRHLANASSIFKDNPHLLALRAIQAVEAGGGTIVLGKDGSIGAS